MITFLTLEQVTEVHDCLIEMSGGCPGILSLGLLISAIETPKAMLSGKFLHKTVYEKAAAYLFHIVQNHAFVDGNKRTGVACALIFLHQNGQFSDYDAKLLEDLVCGVAIGEISKAQTCEFFQM